MLSLSLGDVYICGCGGSDYVSGDRLRSNGDCASADMIQADPSRINAASNSLKAMSTVFEKLTPNITQVIYVLLRIIFISYYCYINF